MHSLSAVRSLLIVCVLKVVTVLDDVSMISDIAATAFATTCHKPLSFQFYV